MSGTFAPQFVHGVYIPSALLIVGTAIVKKEWLPFAVAIAALLGGWKVYSNRTRTSRRHFQARLRNRSHPTNHQLSLYRSPQGAQARCFPGIPSH